MINKTALALGILLMVVAQTCAWFQLNGQFVWKWCKDHPWLMIILPSIPVSFFYFYGTTYLVQGFQGSMWPGRFVSFGAGIIVFTFLVYTLNNEPVNAKTIASLGLAIALICIQVLWKA